MRRADRAQFDHVFDAVLRTLPPALRRLLDAVPVCVDDRPTPELLTRVGMEHDQTLLGLYTGMPLTEFEFDFAGEPSELITLFREPLTNAARNRRGVVDERVLAEQIRITLLHELGHHYGLDEERLERLGYG